LKLSKDRAFSECFTQHTAKAELWVWIYFSRSVW